MSLPPPKCTLYHPVFWERTGLFHAFDQSPSCVTSMGIVFQAINRPKVLFFMLDKLRIQNYAMFVAIRKQARISSE